MICAFSGPDGIDHNALNAVSPIITVILTTNLTTIDSIGGNLSYSHTLYFLHFKNVAPLLPSCRAAQCPLKANVKLRAVLVRSQGRLIR